MESAPVVRSLTRTDSVVLSTRVQRDLAAEVASLADRRGVGRSELVRRLLESAVRAERQELTA